MKKSFAIIRKLLGKKSAPRGTALLVALLVMGILTAVSLGVSALVVREMGATRLVLDSGQAYYSAEAGIELALLQLEENLPGFERAGLLGEVDEGFDWTIKNLANEYPYLDDEKFDATDAPLTVYYGVMDLNKSVTIPLYTVGDDGVLHGVEKFLVQFYAGFDRDDLSVDIDPSFLTGWDVLRWKIYGLTTGVNSGGTESINDLTAVSFLVSGDDEMQTNAMIPSWFGSHDCNEFDVPDGIECATYANQSHTVFEEIHSVGADGGDLVQDVYAGTCLPTEAREHYSYEFGQSAEVSHCYKISEFLNKHNYNYLSLTNLMNPLVFKRGYDNDEKALLSKLYYRVQLGSEDQVVREFADITSVGESGDSTIRLNVLKKRDSVLPVFNFALYHMD
jgi:hypothetical protein